MSGRADGRHGDTRRQGPGPDVAVVIVNYESGPALLSCVEGWRAEGVSELVVVESPPEDASAVPDWVAALADRWGVIGRH